MSGGGRKARIKIRKCWVFVLFFAVKGKDYRIKTKEFSRKIGLRKDLKGSKEVFWARPLGMEIREGEEMDLKGPYIKSDYWFI